MAHDLPGALRRVMVGIAGLVILLVSIPSNDWMPLTPDEGLLELWPVLLTVPAVLWYLTGLGPLWELAETRFRRIGFVVCMLAMGGLLVGVWGSSS